MCVNVDICETNVLDGHFFKCQEIIVNYLNVSSTIYEYILFSLFIE